MQTEENSKTVFTKTDEIRSKRPIPEVDRLVTIYKKKYPIRGDINKYKQLQLEYKLLCDDLNQKHNQETVRTKAELKWIYEIKKMTKLQIIPQFWIGNHCLDYFIPALKMAIEIDGPIHNKEFKIKKDQYRDENLSKLNIPVMSIPNEDIERVHIKFFSHFKFTKRLSTYQKRKMYVEIYLRTKFTQQLLNK